MIYFAQPSEGGPVKIGYSENVPLRLKQLESRYGQQLTLIGTAPGGRAEERAIHDRFGHLRLGRTEQFRPGQEIADFIGQPILVGANPEAVEAMSPVNSVVSILTTPEYRTWMEEFMRHLGEIEVSDVVREGIRRYAAETGFRSPPRR